MSFVRGFITFTIVFRGQYILCLCTLQKNKQNAHEPLLRVSAKSRKFIDSLGVCRRPVRACVTLRGIKRSWNVNRVIKTNRKSYAKRIAFILGTLYKHYAPP